VILLSLLHLLRSRSGTERRFVSALLTAGIGGAADLLSTEYNRAKYVWLPTWLPTKLAGNVAE
jgi:hypothetical protein